MMDLERTKTHSFSTPDSLLIFYLTLVRPKLEYASTVRNSVTSTDNKKLEGLQQKFVVICHSGFFTHELVTYEGFPKFRNLRTLHGRRLHLVALSFISVYYDPAKAA